MGIVLLEVMEVETMEILVVNKKLATVVVKLDTFQETAHKVVEEATTVVVDSVVTTVVDVPATTVDKLDISHVTAHQKKPTKVPVTLVVNKVTSVAIALPVVTPTVVEISTTATIKCC